MKFGLALFLLIGVAGAMPVAAQDHVALAGQVICCAECWTEADRTKVEYGTAEDLLKAKSCVEGGDPTLLAVRELDKFRFYELSPRRFRLPGRNWLGFVGKRVAVSGTIERKKRDVIRVKTLKVMVLRLVEQEAAQIQEKKI